MIDPPLLAPGTLKRHVRAAPGEVVSDSAATQNNALRPLYEVNFGPAVQYVQQEVQQISMRLEDVMMANIFANMSLETPRRDDHDGVHGQAQALRRTHGADGFRL